MLWTIIIVGGVWFWLLTLIYVVVSTGFIYDEEPQRAGIALTVYLVILQLLSDVNLWTWATTHWRRTLVGILVYLLAGLLWAAIRFAAVLRERTEGYLDQRLEFLRANGIADATRRSSVPEHLRHHWRARVSHAGHPLNASDFRSEIITWMTGWPFSVLLALVNNPLRGAAVWVYNRSSRLFDAMAERAAKRVGLYDDTSPPASPPSADQPPSPSPSP